MPKFKSRDPFDRWLEAVVVLLIDPVVDGVRRLWRHARTYWDRRQQQGGKPDQRNER